MTPEGSADEERPLDAAREKAVSDLLAGARARGSVPADVSAQLDDVLVGLVAERAGERAGGGRDEPVVADLVERRRRRWPNLLVAAATVAVVGLGLANVLETGVRGAGEQFGGTTVTSDESGAEAGESKAGAEARSGDASADTKALPGGSLAGDSEELPRLQRLRSDSLALDVQRLAEFALVTGRAPSAPRALATCARPRVDPGSEVIAVSFDETPATLVIQPSQDGVRRADVYACDDATVRLATTSVRVE